jgi:hypothetical protein
MQPASQSPRSIAVCPWVENCTTSGANARHRRFGCSMTERQFDAAARTGGQDPEWCGVRRVWRCCRTGGHATKRQRRAEWTVRRRVTRFIVTMCLMLLDWKPGSAQSPTRISNQTSQPSCEQHDGSAMEGCNCHPPIHSDRFETASASLALSVPAGMVGTDPRDKRPGTAMTHRGGRRRTSAVRLPGIANTFEGLQSPSADPHPNRSPARTTRRTSRASAPPTPERSDRGPQSPPTGGLGGCRHTDHRPMFRSKASNHRACCCDLNVIISCTYPRRSLYGSRVACATEA